MDFAFSDEQRQFRHSVRAFLAQHYIEAPGRPGFADSIYADQWQTIAQTLGLAALAVPHDRGGLVAIPSIQWW